jgi:hypothetical protein
MIQQGQVFELKRAGRERRPLWAYRYRVGGRGRARRRGVACKRADSSEWTLGRDRRSGTRLGPRIESSATRCARPAAPPDLAR